jgi:hypothetical protein
MRSLKVKLLGAFIGIVGLCTAFFFAQASNTTSAFAAAPQSAAVASENCTHPKNAITLTIKNKSNVKYCFSGTGYIGYRISNVSTFTNTDKFWVRIYPNNGTTGCFLNVAAKAHPNTKYFDGKHTVTQITINAAHSAPVCP